MKTHFKSSCIYDNPQISPDIHKNSSKVTIHSNKCVLIENFKSILFVSTNEISIKTKMFTIHIQGNNLTIDYYTSYEIKISGNICNIKYDSN